jgi:MATE family multidrug resistance protein
MTKKKVSSELKKNHTATTKKNSKEEDTSVEITFSKKLLSPPIRTSTLSKENETQSLLSPTVITKLHRLPSYLEEACSIWSMAWKVSLTTFCRVSLSTISTAFLGHLGSQELAACALAGIWTGGVQMLIMGFAVSLCTLCGQAYGAKNYELVGIWLQLGLISLTIFSIPVMISYFYVDHILSFITSDKEVLRLARIYAAWSSPTVLPQGIYCALRQYLQAQEIVNPATIVSVLSVGVCFISNYILIYGIGPFDGLGFIGSPIAQVVASIFQPVALVAYACWYKGYHKKTWYGFTWACIEPERIKRFVSLSLGMTLNFALDEWVYNAVTAVAGSLGAMNLAANSVLFNLWSLIFGVFWGFGLPTQVRAANFLGANAPECAQRTTKVGFVLGGISAGISALFVYICRTSLISFYTPDPFVGAIIEDTLPIFCFAVFLSGLHVILAAVVEAMGLASTLVFITASGSWLINLPTSYLLGIVLQEGLHGLWWGSVTGEGTKFILMTIALIRIDWKQMARKAVKLSEGELDEMEMEEEVSMRASILLTPSAMSPVITSYSTPQQVHPRNYNRKSHHPEELEQAEENKNTFRARSISYTGNTNE